MILGLKELWRRRALAFVALVAAAAISLLAVYNVSPFPPSIAKRSHVEARGTIQILVDSAISPIANARRDLTGLTARAGVFARLIAGGDVVSEMAKANGIPVKQIDVAGPAPLPGEAPGAELPPAHVHPYGVEVTQEAELPIINVVTRAPTVDEARDLAAAAPAAVTRVVESIQREQGTPAERRVEFRVLGPAEAAPTDDSLGKKVALALFVVLTGAFIALILALPRFVAAWRAADQGAPDWDPDHEPQDHPTVLVLPTDAGGGSEEGDAAAPRVEQGRE